MVDIPKIEPTEFSAGDTVKWARDLADYKPGDGWTLTYAFRGLAGRFDVTATASGTEHAVTIAAATSKGYAPGSYAWAAFVTKASERFEIGRGSVTVRRNLADPATVDPRSQAQRAVDDLTAALAEFRSSGGRIRRYRIADREMEFEAVADLLKLLRFWQSKLASEQSAARLSAGLGLKTRVQVRF